MGWRKQKHTIHKTGHEEKNVDTYYSDDCSFVKVVTVIKWACMEEGETEGSVKKEAMFDRSAFFCMFLYSSCMVHWEPPPRTYMQACPSALQICGKWPTW
jgi:hypothetical protein